MRNEEELAYLNLLSDIINCGSIKDDRTGTGTYSLFGTQLRFSLENNKIPMLTTKKMFTKGVIEELLFFLRGETDTKKLEAKGVNIWKGNTSRDFLDKRGLSYLPEGDMGLGYGWQWRNFGGEKETAYHTTRHPVESGIDQVANLIKQLKEDPNSRRMIISAWNPKQLHEISLPPCHILYQAYVDNGKLSAQFYQRSADFFLGSPFNILSYSILTRILAKISRLQAKELIMICGDSHIYTNHLNQVKQQISRTPYDFPKLKINKDLSLIEDIENLSFEDFEIINYNHHPAIIAPMAI